MEYAARLALQAHSSDLINRIDAIRKGEVDIGRVTGQEARDIFVDASSPRSLYHEPRLADPYGLELGGRHKALLGQQRILYYILY